MNLYDDNDDVIEKQQVLAYAILWLCSVFRNWVPNIWHSIATTAVICIRVTAVVALLFVVYIVYSLEKFC